MQYYPRYHSEFSPGKIAYIMAKTGEAVTYLELEQRANQCAHLFREMGLRTGDHIAILMENNRHFLEIVWAAQRTGLYYTAISRHLTAAEVGYIVEDCQARLVLTSFQMKEVAVSLPGHVENAICWLMVGGTIEGFDSYEDLVKSQPTDPISDEAQGVDMLYTSGTTGRPKGVVQTEAGGVFDGSMPVQQREGLHLFEYDSEMVYLSPAPLYHAAPLKFCVLVHQFGGTTIIMDGFDAVEALRLIEKHRITHSQWVPTMFVKMLKLPVVEQKRHDVSSMRIAIHGAGPISIATKEQMIEWWGPILVEYYAGTEGAGATVITSVEWLNHKGSVGKAAEGAIHILDDDGRELPVNETGTVYFGGGRPFEYFNDQAKTVKSRSSHGWSTMGDVGNLDEDGYLYLTDRKADVIISGGVNIYPQESEKVLIGHPKVADVAVFGVPNEEFGEEVRAVVQPLKMRDAGRDLEEELINYCRSQISKLKCPVKIDFRESLPRTPTGKLMKKGLRDEYANSH